MIDMKRTVGFYKTADGYCPILKFLESLSGKAAKKVAWALSLLEEIERLPVAYFKKLTGTDGIWEVRVSVSTDTFRIFCFFSGNTVVVLTHGLMKKTQKTPPREIERAEAYKRDHFSRRNDL